jgi:DNA-binding NarL/FixJ family response regulator
MNESTVRAIAHLQSRALKARADDFYATSCAEFALDELVNNPNRSGTPEMLVWSASRNARKKSARRAAKCAQSSLSDLASAREPGVSDSYDEIFIRDMLSRTALPPRDREILELLANGRDADDISLMYDVPVQRSREWISRARKRVRTVVERSAA